MKWLPRIFISKAFLLAFQGSFQLFVLSTQPDQAGRNNSRFYVSMSLREQRWLISLEREYPRFVQRHRSHRNEPAVPSIKNKNG
jgi:hypothetical protein